MSHKPSLVNLFNEIKSSKRCIDCMILIHRNDGSFFCPLINSYLTEAAITSYFECDEFMPKPKVKKEVKSNLIKMDIFIIDYSDKSIVIHPTKFICSLFFKPKTFRCIDEAEKRIMNTHFVKLIYNNGLYIKRDYGWK